MQPSDHDHPAPRETAAGLQRGEQAPPVSGAPIHQKANPASLANLYDDRSSPDQQSTRAKSQRGKHVTADKWNQ